MSVAGCGMALVVSDFLRLSEVPGTVVVMDDERVGFNVECACDRVDRGAAAAGVAAVFDPDDGADTHPGFGGEVGLGEAQCLTPVPDFLCVHDRHTADLDRSIATCQVAGARFVIVAASLTGDYCAMNELTRRIRLVREATGTIEDVYLAMIDLTRSDATWKKPGLRTFHRWLSGDTPSVEHLATFCHVTEVSADYILCLTDDPSPRGKQAPPAVRAAARVPVAVTASR